MRWRLRSVRTRILLLVLVPVLSLVGIYAFAVGITARDAVSLAKAKVARSIKFVGQNAVQTHGGIGITMELAIGHYFKRATMIESQFGSADHHLARYEALTLPA